VNYFSHYQAKFALPLSYQANLSNRHSRRLVLLSLISLATLLTACGSLPQSGPSTKAFSADQLPLDGRIRLVALTPEVVQQLGRRKAEEGFAKSFTSAITNSGTDNTLAPIEPRLGIGNALSGARGITLPEQIISTDGVIKVPFAGDIKALDRLPSAVANDITQALRGKAHQPQVLVRLVRSTSALVTVVGEVASSTRVSLSARGERVLDAVAAAGGSKQPIHKTTLQLTRGSITTAMPLERIIKEPQHNIRLQSGDILTAIFQPYSFTALGATTQNNEINFEAQGISLSQALARVGGLQDARADAQGVFIFRLESNEAIAKILPAGTTTASSVDAENKTPVIYQIDLKRPESFFIAQNFLLENKDLLYISNAPATDWQKFANIIYTIALPAISTVNAVR
jgi:polysaccharide biosynthesis/export protein